MKWVDEILQEIKQCDQIKDLESLRLRVFGKKGLLTNEFSNLKNISDGDKKQVAKEPFNHMNGSPLVRNKKLFRLLFFLIIRL